VGPLCHSVPPSPCHHQAAAAAPLRDVAALLLLLLPLLHAARPHPLGSLQHHPLGLRPRPQAFGLHLQLVQPQQQH
jgi:hypothetical protein